MASRFEAPLMGSEQNGYTKEAVGAVPAVATTSIPGRHDSKVNRDVDAGAAQEQESDVGERDTTTMQEESDKLALDTLIVDIVQDRSRPHTPRSAGLHIETGVQRLAPQDPPVIFETPVDGVRPLFTSPVAVMAGNSSSLRSNLSSNSITSSLSPGSTSSNLTSPYLAAMLDITPLPSPVMGSEQAAAWRKAGGGKSMDDTTRSVRASSLTSAQLSPSPRRKKAYGSLLPAAVGPPVNMIQEEQGSGRNRSISDFVPEQLQNIRHRHATFGPGNDKGPTDYHMQREANLATQRGLVINTSDASTALPTPPPSNTSVAEDDDDDQPTFLEDGEPTEILHIHCGINNKKRRFRQLRHLGQGTFSKVMLATNERIPPNPSASIEKQLDPQRLVAIKVIEHGPAGGADEERIEISLQREVEMLKSVSHPSLIHLKACEDQLTRTLLVLTYCPGGDLFELASDKRHILTPRLVQRMFTELIDAVCYLHSHWIVHRDIKLENVLVNLTLDEVEQIEDPIAHPTPIITLSDLGLSRRIPQPPESPLLSTRCGSEDYAAPEILLGQPYDGRLTDGWALGVLLYALMEGRLPFDVPPGQPERSRTSYRIARCDWIWCKFGESDGEWSPQKGADWDGARLCVESLLKKVRMGRKPLSEIQQMVWVQEGIQVEGGLQMRAEDHDDL